MADDGRAVYAWIEFLLMIPSIGIINWIGYHAWTLNIYPKLLGNANIPFGLVVEALNLAITVYLPVMALVIGGLYCAKKSMESPI